MNKKSAFTLIEIIIVIVILGVIAGFGLPRYLSTLERFKARDAQEILMNVYGAQKRFFVTNNDYATDLNDLDITVPDIKNFHTPVACDQADGTIAYIDRDSTTTYRLSINDKAEITCSAAKNICTKLGF